MSKYSPRLAAAGLAALVFITACSVDGPTKEIAGPRGPTLDLPTTATAKKVEVCLDPAATAGDYNFTMSSFTQGDATDAQTPINPSSLSTTVGPTCFDAATRTSNGVQSPGWITVTASRIDGTPGTFSFTCMDDIANSDPLCDPLAGTNGARGGMSSFHGATITFTFVADPIIVDDGCTYTQGWWKNKGKATTAQFDFDGGVNNGLTVLNTPPKGNVYYVLAHQYIAASLNIANGATISGDAQTAYNAATAYFAAASPGTPVPAGYTKGSITALSTVLDQYNNGIIGPGHCDDVLAPA